MIISMTTPTTSNNNNNNKQFARESNISFVQYRPTLRHSKEINLLILIKWNFSTQILFQHIIKGKKYFRYLNDY